MFTALYELWLFPDLTKICPKKPMEYQMAVSNGELSEKSMKAPAGGKIGSIPFETKETNSMSKCRYHLAGVSAPL